MDARRAVDVVQLAAALASAPAFCALRKHWPDLAAGAAHESTTSAGGTFIRDARRREKAIFLARMLLSDAATLSTPPASVPVGEAPEVVFLGDFLNVEHLSSTTLSVGLRDRLCRTSAIVVNLEGTIAERAHVLAPFQTWRGLKQLAGWSPDGWVSRFDRNALSSWLTGLPPVWFGLANNHVLDDGIDGLGQTVAQIEALGASCFGHVQRDDGATVIDTPTRRVGVAAMSFGHNHPSGVEVNVRFDGLPYELPVERLAAIRAQLAQRGATYFVASLHWGHEHEHEPTPQQERCVEMLWDLGFDGVVGHHPHIVQRIWRRDTKWAAFSLGDFVGGDRTVLNRHAIALALSFDATGRGRVDAWPLVQAPYWDRACTRLYEEAPVLDRWVWQNVFANRVNGGGR